MLIYSNFVNNIDSTTHITHEILNSPGDLVENTLLDHISERTINGHITKELFNVPSTSLSEGSMIFNITKETVKDYFDDIDIYNNTIGNSDLYKIFIVHDFNKDTIPFLKLADFLVFFTETQQLAYNKLLGLDIPSKVIPYPLVHRETKPSKKNQVLLLCQYDPSHNDKYRDIILSWSEGKTDSSLKLIDGGKSGETSTVDNSTLSSINFIFDAFYHKNDAIAFNTFKKSLPTLPKKINVRGNRISNRTHGIIDTRISRAKYVYIYNEEIDYNIARDIIDTGTDQILYSNLRENALLPKALSYGCKVIIAEASNTENGFFRISDIQYITRIKNILRERKHIKKPTYMVDTLDDLNIVHGQPLENNYVFIVNFRNQQNKIKRCLDSIIHNCSNYDIGIAITNDVSTDNSSEIINEFILENSNVDIVYVENTERKLSSRNLYNAGHQLIINDETICIELDGDDFLPEKDVLSFIEVEYAAGALKTLSLFDSYPTKNTDMVINNRKFDFSNPWDHGKCTPWSPLRTYKRHLLTSVELDYFIERSTGEWLKIADDSSINPRMIELSQGKTHVIDEVLYIYDLSGNDHDVVSNWTPFYSHNRLYHALTF